MKYALINSGVVQALEIDPSEERLQELARSYELIYDTTETPGDVQVGWVLINGGLYALAPANGEAPSLGTKITKLALQNRLTDNEFMGILSYVDNTANPYCYAIRMILQKQMSATYVDLSRSDTIAGINILVAAGRITSERAAQILTAPVQAHEVYKP